MAGPAFFWALPIVSTGELLVTEVFGELVSKWLLQGSVCAWTRELVGPRCGWWPNWIYMWSLTKTFSVLTLAATGYIWSAAGNACPSMSEAKTAAVAVLLFGSAMNMIGGKLLKILLYINLTYELITSLGIGTVLFFFQVSSIGLLFTSAGTRLGFDWYLNASI